MSRLALAAGLSALALLGSAPARAQKAPPAADRPSEQDMFGGAAPAAPAPVVPPSGAPGQPGSEPAQPGAPPSAAPPAAGAESAATPPAANDRDQQMLGANAALPEHFSDYQAPENPLAIGGQLYLRAQTSGQSGQALEAWTLTAPNLLDLYLDARPNPRVRAFVLGRMSFDPTAPPGLAVAPQALQGGGGTFAGTSATGFTTFNANRGPTSVLDQMWLRFDIKQRLFVTAGKQHVRWGTGRFWQPTDYLHPVKRNPLDVFDARAGVSMVKVHIPWEERGWNFYGFGVTEDPNEGTTFLRQLAGGGRAEIVVGQGEIGLDALFKDGRRPRFGVDFSTGLWELDVYGDVGLRWGSDFCAVHATNGAAPVNGAGPCPLPGTPPTDPAVVDFANMYAVAPLSGFKVQAVGGANWSHKYNDNDMFTIGAEYFYNQPGYSDTSVYPGLLINSNYTPMLNFFYTGRHYGALFASFPMPYSWNLSTFTVSTLGNLTDQSFISRVDYSYTLLTHLSVEAFLGIHYGHAAGEFRLGFDFADQGLPNVRRDPSLVDVGLALRMKI